VIESQISIPKEYLSPDEVAEMESADIPDETEEEDLLEVEGTPSAPDEGSATADASSAPEAAEKPAEAVEEAKPEESSEASAS
jgi:hypothetical protein